MTRAERNRLTNAVVYFVKNTKSVGKIKLFKLMYLLDFEHYRQTGRSVTGLDYQAWKFGPVPVRLMEEWEDFPDDLAELVHIKPERVFNHVRQNVVLNEGTTFDDADFTPRQLGIMEQLSHQYADTLSPEMIDVTHAQNGAWEQVWRNGEGGFEPIPYALALPADAGHREELLDAALEAESFQRIFG